MGKLALITGGVRSGKSKFAQELANKQTDKVLFVATAEALDEEMQLRIKEHRKNRPANWQTLEITLGIGEQIRKSAADPEVIIIDCLTLLLNNIFSRYFPDNISIERTLNKEIEGLLSVIHKMSASFVIVTNEVGLGIVPDNEMARSYRDLLGTANQIIARQSGEVYLMVSGIPVRLK